LIESSQTIVGPASTWSFSVGTLASLGSPNGRKVVSGLRPDFVKLRVNVVLQKDLAGFVGENQISPIFAIPKNIALSGDFLPDSAPLRRLDW
jgi:hypothetical protein